jgi:hypothetical protein
MTAYLICLASQRSRGARARLLHVRASNPASIDFTRDSSIDLLLNGPATPPCAALDADAEKRYDDQDQQGRGLYADTSRGHGAEGFGHHQSTSCLGRSVSSLSRPTLLSLASGLAWLSLDRNRATL